MGRKKFFWAILVSHLIFSIDSWLLFKDRPLNVFILSRASEVGSPTNHAGLRAATRHGVRDLLVRSQVDYKNLKILCSPVGWRLQPMGGLRAFGSPPPMSSRHCNLEPLGRWHATKYKPCLWGHLTWINVFRFTIMKSCPRWSAKQQPGGACGDKKRPPGVACDDQNDH